MRFNGNCRDAMEFYNDCLGGKLSITTYEDSSISEQVPADMKKKIVHAMLTSGNVRLYGADTFGQNATTLGDLVALDLECDSEEEIRKYFENLSREGG